jgi:hypothetical protein
MSGWDAIVLESLEQVTPMWARIDALFAHARDTWDFFRLAEATLTSIRTKVLTHEGARIIVQANPGRKRSIHARVDAKTIAQRPCFLCLENLPAAERGLGCGNLVILPNPYPILKRHCTIPDRLHRPQRLTGRVATMLKLARAVGPEMLVFYNGSRCGASAPDHFHFQACDAQGVPVINELSLAGAGPALEARTSFGRKLLVLADPSAERMQQRLEQAVAVLGRPPVAGEVALGEEPLLSLLAYYREPSYYGLLFPRAAHRPASYFAEGAGRLAISPAALEMAGLLVVAEPEQFGRVDAKTARTIYQEVSLGDARFRQLVEEVGKFREVA